MAHKNQQNLMRYKPKMEEKIIEEITPSQNKSD